MTPASFDAPRPMCAAHPDRAAQKTCQRCGRFMCGECSGDRLNCTECFAQLSQLPSSADRARWVIMFLYAGAGVDAFSFATSAWMVAAPGPSTARDVLEGLGGLAILFAYLGAVITFLRWQHLCVRQVQSFGIELGITPGWAVGYWFIPFANLFKPYQVMRSVLSGLGGEAAVAEARLGGWWTLWIISSVLSQIESRLALSNGLAAEPPQSSYVAGLFASVAGVAAALFCITMVKTVQRYLDDAHPERSRGTTSV